MEVTKCIVMAWIMFYCDAVTYRQQLDHIARRRRESRGIYPIPSRRQDNSQMSVILGAPSMPSHLPEAEPILPGHTLIRPARGMLKSAIKYPHLELDNGAGVYGNVNNLGIRYDGRNERVQYSGFRRTPDNLIMAVPKYKSAEPRLSLSSFFELSDRSTEDNDEIIRGIEIRRPKRPKSFVFKIEPAFIKSKGQRARSHAKQRKDGLQIVPVSYHNYLYKKISTKEPKIKRFRPPGSKPKKGNLKSLADNDSMRRDRIVSLEKNGDNKPLIFIPDSDSSSDEYVVQSSEEKKKDKSKEVKSKMDWFWKSKDLYNNIKINLDAPDLEELMPAISKEKLRQWWFYHQDDFTPFQI